MSIHDYFTPLIVAAEPVQSVDVRVEDGRRPNPKPSRGRGGSEAISDLVSPFTSARLRPTRQRTRNVIVS